MDSWPSVPQALGLAFRRPRPILYAMLLTLLAVVGLIVGFALGLGSGRLLWGRTRPAVPEASERSERRPARYPRSHEPSTPPQHRPTPRPRPVTALHHPNPISPEVVEPVRPAPAPRVPVAFTATSDRPAAESAPPPVVEPEPFDKYEYRPAPAPEPEPERAVSIGKAHPPDRQLLNDLLESSRRLTADAENRLQREGAMPVRRLDSDQRLATRRAAPAPADNDLLARHRKLEEDSRRMSRRADPS